MRNANHNSDLGNSAPNADVSPDAAKRALESVLASQDFRQTERLRSLLNYVVVETLAGRGDAITNRTIAQDIYARGLGEDEVELGVVRVDAGRLRRRLSQYYAGEGAEDPVVITIDTGAYTPTFTSRDANSGNKEPDAPALFQPRPSKHLLSGVGAGLLIALAAFALWQLVSGGNARLSGRATPETAAPHDRQLEAFLSKSPASLQAVIAADQGRGLMFPAPDTRRFEILTQLFEHAINLDPNYFGGYAGLSQIQGMQVGLMPLGPRRDALLAEQAQNVDRAMSLRPDHSWTQSARAWHAFAQGNLDSGLRISESALEVAPDDQFAHDFDAMISLFSGQYERAIKSGQRALELRTVPSSSPSRFAIGFSQFHLGDYPEAVQTIETALSETGTVSPIVLAYLAAAQIESGDTLGAAESLDYLNAVWSIDRTLELLSRSHSSQEPLDDLRNALGGATE